MFGVWEGGGGGKLIWIMGNATNDELERIGSDGEDEWEKG